MQRNGMLMDNEVQVVITEADHQRLKRHNDWISGSLYAEGIGLLPGEVGRIHDVRYVVHSDEKSQYPEDVETIGQEGEVTCTRT